MSMLRNMMGVVAQVLPDRERDPLIDQHRVLGKPVDRIDGRAKVTGAATFTAEYQLDGLVHAAIVSSTIARGALKSLDTAAAESAPGVLRVLTHHNTPKMKVPPPFSPEGRPETGSTRVKILNTDEIYWNGQPIALVIADTQDRAEYAASLVRVTYKPEDAVVAFHAAIPNAKKPAQVMGDSAEVASGKPDEVLAGAAHKVDLLFDTPGVNHNAIEPHATIAVWNSEDSVTVYDASQYTVGAAQSLAIVFDLKKDAVRVLAPFVGGGFGGKGGIWSHNQLAVVAAKVVQRPVRINLSRAGVFRLVGGRTPSQQRVALAADATGKITALIHEGTTAQSFHNEFPEQFSFAARHLYATPTYRIGQTVTELDRIANTFMRAPGESIGTFALESAVDALAFELKMDPIEFRMRNEPEKDPVSGHDFSSRHLREAYRMGAERFGWAERPAAVRAQQHGDWLIGQGVATGTYPVYRMPTAASVRIDAEGKATVKTSAQEMGMGTATVQTQHAAERLGLPMSKIAFQYGDSTLPMAAVAGGSSQTISIALAVQKAADKVFEQLLSLARKFGESPLHGSKVDDLFASREGLYRRDHPEIGESYANILRRAGQAFVEAEETTGPPLEILKHSMHSYAAQFCEVRVHRSTGEVRINRFLGAFDTGRILNPKTAVSQFRGGIIMGIGMALTEETLWDDRSGRIANATLAEYHVPVQADIPHIEVVYTDIPDPLTPLGAHGIGEIGITGTAAAIANAVFHATGRRITSLPITLDKLL